MQVKINNSYKPFWNDNSLSKISKSLFTSQVVNNTNWNDITDITTVTNFEYDSCTIQIVTSGLTTNLQSGYYYVSVNNTNFYYFADTITLDNISTQPVATVTLKLDKWGTCVSNISSDFSTWTTQVLATNKELNLYDFWTYGYYNMSTYTFLKNVYPNLANIQLIKYKNQQYVYEEQTSNSGFGWNQEGYNYYYYKIGYLVTAYNNTNSPQTITHIAGTLKDYYAYTTQSGNTTMFTSNLASYINDYLPFVFFAPIATWNEALSNHSGTYTGAMWTIPFLLSFSTDKDIGLIQLPFSLTNKNLHTIYEFTATGNEFLNQINTYTVNGTNYYWPTYYSGDNNSTGGATLNNVIDYLVNVNGININNFYLMNKQSIPFNWTITSIIIKDGFSNAIANEPWNFNIGPYVLEPFFILYPMLYNYYSWNCGYMGQQVSYTSKHVNNVTNLTPFNQNNQTNANPIYVKFSANYPNLTLNVYASDNVTTNANSPLGQINLSTAFLPNTTNPSATFKTNEQSIINNAATLKNLDISKSMLGFLGGVGLNSLLNPLSLFTTAASVGLDVNSVNINYSNSFGKAKMNELGHTNTLQTAGDNLGSPDNLLTYWCMVPGLNDIQNIIGQVDKYGYLYNQWDKFNNLFGNYYHNYIKLSQNADLVIYQNANMLLKSWQEYLINQFINGVVIWNNLMPDGSVSFVDAWQLYNDCIYNKENFWNIQQWDAHYHANFKAGHAGNTLSKLELTQMTETIEQEPKKEAKFVNKCKKL